MRWSACAAGALAVILAACPATAQVFDPDVDVTAGQADTTVAWDGTSTIEWTVSNEGELDGELALRLDVDTQLWSTDWDEVYTGPSQLDAGASRTVKVTVAPVDPGTGTRPSSDIVLEASLTDASSAVGAVDRVDTASAATTLAYIPEPVPPALPPPPDHTVRNSIVGGAAGLVLLAAGVYLATGLLFTVRPPSERVLVRPGLSGYARFDVRNLAPWRQTVEVRYVPDEGPWRLATDTRRVQIGGRQTGHATIFVQSTQSADPDMTGDVCLQARASRFHPWWRKAKARVAVEHVDLTVWSANAIADAWRQAGSEPPQAERTNGADHANGADGANGGVPKTEVGVAKGQDAKTKAAKKSG